MKRALNPYRACAALACGIFGAVLTTAFIAIVVYTGNPWPWFEIVHESGDRTLLGTVFFVEHAAREWPLDLILGTAVAGAALFALPLPDVTDRSSQRDRRWILTVALMSVTGLILGGTWWEGRGALVHENLLQFPTRPGARLEWGGHWRYHLLSHVMLISVSFGLASLLVLATQGVTGKGNRIGVQVFGVTVAVFAGLTFVFIPNLDPLIDPVFIGHQLRESFTHALVTIPGAFGACLLLARRQWDAPSRGTASLNGPVLTGIFGVIVGLFLLVSGLVRSVAHQGQSESLAVLLFPHFFEHTFSYVVAGLTAGLVFEWVRAR